MTIAEKFRLVRIAAAAFSTALGIALAVAPG
jgi:hypothetical protein